ncbi:MAG: DNA polymerase I [Acidipila sp.]|nr:DNA polymerase I [Acidipila sp.]
MPEANPKRLFLIDAMGFIFRAFFAPMDRLRNPQGMPTKVPYIFNNMVRKLLREWEPEYVAAVFDVSGPTFRDELFKQYKAQRPPMPDDLSIQLPFVRRVCEAMRLPILEHRGFEADDVIGTLARLGAEKGLDVFIVTSDKDMLQLVSADAANGEANGEASDKAGGKAGGKAGDKLIGKVRDTVAAKKASPGGERAPAGRVRVLNPTKDNLLFDAKKVEEIMGVPPALVPDVMALMGDNIDNIPGAKGIGEKGAREIIQRFGSAESALERAQEVEGKRYREALVNSRDNVLLSKKLATIDTHTPVELNLAALVRMAPDFEALRGLYTELGFTSLLREMAASAPADPATAPAAIDCAPLDSPAALTKFLEGIPKGQEVAFWIAPLSAAARDAEREVAEGGAEGETEAADTQGELQYNDNSRTQVVEIGISPGPGVARTTRLDEKGEMLKALQPWLADRERLKIVHDPKAAALLLEGSVTLEGTRHATMYYSYLLRPTTAKHELGDVALRHLNQALSGGAGEKAEALGRLAPMLRAEVEAQGLAELYETMDLPLASVLARMQRTGLLVDRAALAAMSVVMEKEIAAHEAEIYQLAGSTFNINSSQQLGEILFDKLGLSAGRKTGKTKGRSTAADILQDLAAKHPLPKKILDYREVAKLKSTYVDALPKLIDPRDGRLHSSLSQTVAATGRLASSNPNLQNIPVRTEVGRQIRAAFVAPPGSVLLSADYSQIELRILAHFSGDAVLLDAFEHGEDIHSRTAQEVFGVGALGQTAEHRRSAKAINFGIIYGLSAFGLAQQLGIEHKEAAKFIAAYFARYTAVKEYLDQHLETVRKSGFTRTLFGRVRHIPEITAPQAMLRNSGERIALNTPLQGTAADLIKLAMIDIDRKLAASKLDARMILQVHDELLFEVAENDRQALRELVKSAMEQVYALRVPLLVEIKIGHNWRDMQ